MYTLCFQVKGVHDWTPEQKNSMRRLFNHCLKEWPSLVHCMRDAQGTLVFQATERGGYDWYALAAFDLELIRLTDDGKLDVAIEQMAEKLEQAIQDYWPDCAMPTYQEFLTERSRRRELQTTSAAHPAR